MAKTVEFDEAKGAECATEIAEIADRGRLAALGLSQPILVARRNQLERERLRLTTQKTGDPRIGQLDRAIALADGRVGEVEVATQSLQVDFPDTPEQGGAVIGRVTENGLGRRDDVVSVIDPEGKVVSFDCTGDVGAFEIAAPAGEGLRLRVTDKENAVLYRDATPFNLQDGDIIRREIDLSAAPPICPEPGEDPTEPPTAIKVPDLIGQTEAEAVRLLVAADLMAGERSTAEDQSQIGLVVGQTPAPDAEVERGSAVDIVIGIAPGIDMPDLRGETLDAALDQIKEIGLNPAEPRFTPSAEFAGRVIEHTPKFGDRVAIGDTVILLVGTTPRIQMPDLRNAPIEDAQAKLAELGLKAEDPIFELDPNRAGLVIRHTPVAGVSVEDGASVTLVVGVDRVESQTMPDLVKQELETALKILDAAGLKAGQIETVADPDQAGRVIKQEPEAGAPVSPEIQITLVVGTGNDARDLRSAISFAARDPRVATLNVTADTLSQRLTAAGIRSVDALEKFARLPVADAQRALKLRTAAEARQLQAALGVALTRLR